MCFWGYLKKRKGTRGEWQFFIENMEIHALDMIANHKKGWEQAPSLYRKSLEGLCILAGPTGLEPAPSDVTGRRYNQLNYGPASEWWAEQGSNL